MRVYDPGNALEVPRRLQQNEAVIDLTRHDSVRDIDQSSEESFVFNLSDLESSDSDITNEHSYAKPHSTLFQCDSCSYATPVRQYLNSHQKRHINSKLKMQFKPLSKMFKCDICSYQTTIRSYMTRHKKRHLNTKLPIIKCPFCPFKTLSNGSIKTHKLTCASHIQAESDMKSLQDIEKINRLFGNEASSMDFTFGDEEDDSCDFRIYENGETTNSSFNRLLQKMKAVVDEESDSDEDFDDLDLDDDDLDVNSFVKDDETGKENPSIDSLENQEQDEEEEDFNIVEDTTSTSSNMIVNINTIETLKSAENNTLGGESDPLRQSVKNVKILQEPKLDRQTRLKRQYPHDVYCCDTCSYRTTVLEYIKRHVRMHKISKCSPILQCSRCPYNSPNKYNFKKHDKKCMLECRKKDKIAQKTNLSAAENSLTSENMDCFKSSSPNESINNNSNENQTPESPSREMRNKTKYEIYKCDNCGYRTPIRSYLKKHNCRTKITQTKKDSSPIITETNTIETRFRNSRTWEIFRCNLCPYKTPVEGLLRAHKKNHHLTEKCNLKCRKCSYRTNNVDSMSKHSKQCRQTLSAWHYCNFCPYKTRQKSLILKHLRKCRLQAKIQVKNKKVSAPDLNTVQSKFKSLDKIEWHFCDSCPFQTTYKYNLTRHNKRCKNKDKKHSVRQKNVKIPVQRNEILKCSFCHYQTTIKGYLTRHIKRHHQLQMKEVYIQLEPVVLKKDPINEKIGDSSPKKTDNHKTSIVKCNSDDLDRFRYNKTLKDFKCRFCDYRSTVKRNLTRHMKRHKTIVTNEVNDEKQLESDNVTPLNASEFLKNFNLKLNDRAVEKSLQKQEDRLTSHKKLINEMDEKKARQSKTVNKDDVSNLNKIDQDNVNYPNKLENGNVQIKVISSVSITMEPVNHDKEWIVELNSDVILKNSANKDRNSTEEQRNRRQVNESNATVQNSDCNNPKRKTSDLFLYCSKCSYKTRKGISYKRHQRRHRKSGRRKSKLSSRQVLDLEVEKLAHQLEELQRTSDCELKEDNQSLLIDTSDNNLSVEVSNKKSDEIVENIRDSPETLRIKSPQQLFRDDSNTNKLEAPKTTVSSEHDVIFEDTPNSNGVTGNTLTVASSHVAQFSNQRESMSKRDIMHCLKCDECFYKMTIQNYFKTKSGKVKVKEPDPEENHEDLDLISCKIIDAVNEITNNDELASNLTEHKSIESNSNFNEVKLKVNKKEQTTPKRPKVNKRKRIIFKCELCGYKTRFKFNYERHLKTHEKKNPPVEKVKKKQDKFESINDCHKKSIISPLIQCDKCKYHSSNREYFNRHLKTVHKISSISSSFIDNLLKCDICAFVTSNLKLWEEHAHTKQKETIFQCPNCSYFSNVRRNFDRHLRRHKNLLKNRKTVTCGNKIPQTKAFKSQKIFKCDLCSYETTVPRYLRRHQKRHSFQTRDNPIKSEVCSEDLQFDALIVKTEEIDSLKRPQTKNSQGSVKPRKKLKMLNILEQELKATYDCDKCTYKSSNKANFRKHVSRHKKKSVVKCSNCSYTTHSLRDLKQHKLIHPLNVLYECTKCPFFTTYISKLKCHELTHKSR